MLSLDLARDCARSLAADRNVTLLYPDDLDARLADASKLAGAHAALVLALVRPLLALASKKVAGVTTWVPGVGVIVVLTSSALVDGVTLLAVIVHELVHARQIEASGPIQTAVDYVGSGELRALREAEASVGLWLRYVVTGVRPSPDDAGVVASDLYHLDPNDKDFAREVVKGVLSVIDTGAVPPHSVARAALAWLRGHAPEAIIAPEYAEHVTEVPT